MTMILLAIAVALPIGWAINKLYDYLTGNEIVFEMEDDEADR